MTRDYAAIRADLNRAIEPSMSRKDRMTAFVDALWPHLSPTGVSWLGIYSYTPGDEGMILEARRDKPACSPLSLQGACGQAYLKQSTLVISDVKLMGENYVACDPRDQSELVIPLFDDAGECWGVYDSDSFDTGSFTQHDATETRHLLVLAGLTTNHPAPVRVV